MYILILATVILIAFYVLEYYRHRQNVAAIPIRVHVNGTRGKSSVTRLIASGLRAGGLKTIAKTTGTLPRMILEDGTEASIERLANANIIEQKYVFRYSAKRNPDAIVIECMAVNPLYQWVTEKMFVKSTIGVITNSRMDHMDLMGNTLESITRSLCNSLPKHGVCYTSEVDQFPIMQKAAHKSHTDMVQVPKDLVTDDEMLHFNYIEHKENVTLALAVCEKLGVPREKALKGMQISRPDPGALKRYFIDDSGKKLFFYNVFAANDPDSTVMIWNSIIKPLAKVEKVIILNTRSDRFFRSKQLVDVCKNMEFDFLVLTGERTFQLASYAKEKGISKKHLIILGEDDPEFVYKKIHSLVKKECHIFAIGNIAGRIKYGAQIVKYFKMKSQGGING